MSSLVILNLNFSRNFVAFFMWENLNVQNTVRESILPRHCTTMTDTEIAVAWRYVASLEYNYAETAKQRVVNKLILYKRLLLNQQYVAVQKLKFY